ncbi:MAG TPA: hypothetical protein VF736_01300 [Pyrinomonadaceae bacterium]|jgi:hypothetical protein
MRNPVFLLLLLLLAATPAAAQATNGIYDFTLGDEYLKHVEFDAAKQADGSTAGSIYLTDDAPVTFNNDVDGAGERPSSYKGFFLKAEADDIVVTQTRTGYQAVVSATVRDSSALELVGLRMLLTVQDNGDNTKVLDKVVWGTYKFLPREWKPSDADLKEDPGVGLRWWATDFERKDDVGYAMPRTETAANTQTYPAGSFEFATVFRPSGDILVKP